MPAPETPVVVTGVGALSALGGGVAALWEGLLAGRSGIRRIERFAAARLPVTTGGEVDGFPHDLPDRDVQMGRRAIAEALEMAGLAPERAARAGFVWATGLDTAYRGPVGFARRSSSACFASLAREFAGPRLMVASACASGTQAVGEALRLLRAGRASACVAGGVSVMLTSFYLIGFVALQALALDDDGDPGGACRPFDRRRRGFALSDGAGALVLETLASARQRGAVPLAEVAGFGVSQDAFDLNRPLPDGSAAEACMREALADAGMAPGDVDAVNAHATGTLLGDLAEAAALRRLLDGAWARVPVSSLKGALGHAMGAAGALEAVAAVLTCRHGLVPPTANLADPDADCELDHVVGRARSHDAGRVLTVSFGMGGQNAAVVLKRVDR
jgi:3-oxoacyl-[acyl-carrier-protein] synthase II